MSERLKPKTQMIRAEVATAAEEAADALFEALKKYGFGPGCINPDTGNALTQEDFDELRKEVIAAGVSASKNSTEKIKIIKDTISKQQNEQESKEMVPVTEQKKCYGVSIRCEESDANTKLVCDDLGNNLHFALAEVDDRGTVVPGDDGLFNTLFIEASNLGYVQVHRAVNDNPFLEPGKIIEVEIGPHKVTIEGTDNPGVLFNNAKPTLMTKELHRTRLGT